ncbi:two-component sensor histidine kinase [Mariprofundus erugo]|uniref:histidine kinase n=1 Tax=Mariprofundus erugo TaxID=2528639 RepID=A0A5R9GZE2_9PROT|nr:ATP-binding protein [Mariprofundus erugo]TLS68224.1 two-component sensor histidine kinase [Mariprofundus erugo]
MKPIFYRALAGGAIALVLMAWIYPTAPFQSLIVIIAVLFLLSLLLQAWLAVSRFDERRQWAFRFTIDIVLASLLLLATGGIDSPFSFLLGLIIISSGAFAWFMLPLVMTVLACICYLMAVYGELWLIGMPMPDTAEALHILLQVSALMLVGGIMAAIARRHAGLRASSDRALSQHRRLKDLHDKLMAAMCEGVIVLDEHLEVSDMNAAAGMLLGEQPISVLTSLPAIASCLHHGGRPGCQCEYRQGEQVLLVAVTRLSNDADAVWLLTLVDISELRHMEWQMHQQEKMAALGQMAAMLAHEIRNPVQTMAQGLEILPAGEVKGVNIRNILHDEMLRLNRLVTTMLNYSQPLQPEPALIYMPAVIRAALMQLKFSEQCAVDIRCELDQLQIDGDHFRLVLDNLLSNAVLNSPPDGRVRVGLTGGELEWQLRVCNRGTIAENVRERLFEPFVSGRSCGVGLGLATVRQVCAVNHWRVGLQQEGELICFCVSGGGVVADPHDEAWAGMAHG